MSPTKKNTTRTSRTKTARPRRRPVVGMLTVPLSPEKQYYRVCGDSYISLTHITWLKHAGVDILAIPYTTTEYDYYMDRINALYFPSGGVFASNSKAYYTCCKEFMTRAMDYNDRGIYFPCYGCCMGMQQMLIIADGNDDLNHLLTKFDSYDNLMLPLIFARDSASARIMKHMPKSLLHKLKTEKCTQNNHMMGLSPQRFKRKGRVNAMFRIVSYNYDRKGKPFVSTIEGRTYPFYGVQWHPERDESMGYFARFFASEAHKNPHRRRVSPAHRLKYRIIDCKAFSCEVYSKCVFYWHKKSSYRRAKLCNVLNLENTNPDLCGV